MLDLLIITILWKAMEGAQGSVSSLFLVATREPLFEPPSLFSSFCHFFLVSVLLSLLEGV